MLSILDPGEPVAMFKIDLDNFKQVNEDLGHAAGDEAIRLYCKTVINILGTVGEVYRRGGDEVVVLAPGLGETVARELGEVTRLKIEEIFRDWASSRHLTIPPTASIGLAISDSVESRSRIVERADEAQRQAKHQGKNRVVVAP
jgi:diguanylate cyclase (GGDEF)-like protein